MARSKTSNAWLREHVNDHYVQQAKADGWRSRAAFKLIEIDDKDHLLKRGEVVVDLGATPGGWSQLAAKRVGESGQVIALDLLELQPIRGVEFIQGDFREENVLVELLQRLNGRHVGVVLSDMAPNISGVSVTDQARAMHLCELALDFAKEHLSPSGTFLVKVFQGTGFEDFMKLMRATFLTVQSRKPKASRDRSSEIYLLGRSLRE
jgi:23S rRNA (uridine2552-2'-O)-methyltransferase